MPGADIAQRQAVLLAAAHAPRPHVMLRVSLRREDGALVACRVFVRPTSFTVEEHLQRLANTYSAYHAQLHVVADVTVEETVQRWTALPAFLRPGG